MLASMQTSMQPSVQYDNNINISYRKIVIIYNEDRVKTITSSEKRTDKIF